MEHKCNANTTDSTTTASITFVGKHNHDQDTSCKHENIKFCKKCDVPYCLDCGREWRENTYYTLPYYPYWQYPQTTWPDWKYLNNLLGGQKWDNLIQA